VGVGEFHTRGEVRVPDGTAQDHALQQARLGPRVEEPATEDHVDPCGPAQGDHLRRVLDLVLPIGIEGHHLFHPRIT
jgi:hypothetical protein